MPAIVQTAREESDEMYLRVRLLKEHSFSVILRGNRKHNYFILYKYNIFKIDAFKDFEKWAQRPDTKAKEAAAQKSAWAAFTKQFPNADKTQFVAQINIDENRNITQKCSLRQEKGPFKACLAQTGSTGVRQ